VETWDAIRSRRNVRAYAEEAIAPEHLDQVLEAARRSAGHVARSAATIALVAPRSDDARTRDLIHNDLGQATMSIMVAAADLGIGSAHSAVADQDLARRLLGFPEDRLCLADLARPPATARSRRSSGPTGARSPTSCTAASGSDSMDYWGIHPGCAPLKEAKYVHWSRRHRRS
jgi:hypothetical protein